MSVNFSWPCLCFWFRCLVFFCSPKTTKCGHHLYAKRLV